jgi:hypothetical protein
MRIGLSGCVALLALSGCTPSAAEPSPTPSPTPAYSSDEEAYEAAIAVYAEYSRVSEEVGRAGGEGAEQFLDYTNREYANQLLREVHAMREKGLRFTGAGTFEPKGLAEIDASRRNLALRVCEDIGDTRLIDAEGNDVTAADRTPITPIIVGFITTKSGRFVISGSDLWSGEDFC